MSCPYYFWKDDYACRKTGKEVNSDVYYRYCRDYSYDDCPIYKQEEQSSGCFLTSACVEARNLQDDCEELMILRNFRDTYLKEIDGGEVDIKEYYYLAPQIVSAINNREDSLEIWNDIYEKVILKCIEHIKTNQLDNAYILYKTSVLKLKEQYL